MPKIVTRYSEVEKLRAVATYIGLGKLSAVSTELNIPYDTLKDWKVKDWWKTYERQIKNEENAALSAKFRKIVNKVQEQILERLDNGDHHLTKDGEIVRVPVKARDLSVVGAISTDKVLNLDKTLDAKEETISIEQRLKMIAQELSSLTKSKREPVIIDVEVTNGLQTEETQDPQT